jgi:hypothetical protein
LLAHIPLPLLPFSCPPQLLDPADHPLHAGGRTAAPEADVHASSASAPPGWPCLCSSLAARGICYSSAPTPPSASPSWPGWPFRLLCSSCRSTLALHCWAHHHPSRTLPSEASTASPTQPDRVTGPSSERPWSVCLFPKEQVEPFRPCEHLGTSLHVDVCNCLFFVGGKESAMSSPAQGRGGVQGAQEGPAATPWLPTPP